MFTEKPSVLVSDLDTAVGRVLKGARYLDGQVGPGWEQMIEPRRLDIGHIFNCVIGQLMLKGHYCTPSVREGVECGFSCGMRDLLAVFGYRSKASARSYDLLTQAWKLVLETRRSERLRREAGRSATFEANTSPKDPLTALRHAR